MWELVVCGFDGKVHMIVLEENDIGFQEYYLTFVFRPGLTLKTMQRRQQQVPGEMFSKRYLIFEAQIGTQNTRIGGTF